MSQLVVQGAREQEARRLREIRIELFGMWQRAPAGSALRRVLAGITDSLIYAQWLVGGEYDGTSRADDELRERGG